VKITDDEVLHVAALARIRLEDGEVRGLRIQLERILDYMDILSAVDTAGVIPAHHPLPLVNAMRDDVEQGCQDLDDVLRNAPQHEDGYIVVPRVIEQG
jgi:aspartyl-tRNA(Asn)/glutamyl-tRNA(Gln) amidotransferase subunit C